MSTLYLITWPEDALNGKVSLFRQSVRIDEPRRDLKTAQENI